MFQPTSPSQFISHLSFSHQRRERIKEKRKKVEVRGCGEEIYRRRRRGNMRSNWKLMARSDNTKGKGIMSRSSHTTLMCCPDIRMRETEREREEGWKIGNDRLMEGKTRLSNVAFCCIKCHCSVRRWGLY